MADMAIGGILEIGSEASVSTFLCSLAFLFPFLFLFSSLFFLFLFLFLDTWYLIYSLSLPRSGQVGWSCGQVFDNALSRFNRL